MTSGSNTSSNAAAHRRSTSHSASAHRQQHPVRTPSENTTASVKSKSPSPERVRKRANLSRTLNGHATPRQASGNDDSEAETDILSDGEQLRSIVKTKIVKHEPKDEVEIPSISIKTQSELSHSNAASSRASSVMEDVPDKTNGEHNGIEDCKNGHIKSAMKDRLHLSSEYNKTSSRAQSADARSVSPHDHSDRSREVQSAEPRKRKFSDAHRLAKLEPPRQKPRFDDPARLAKIAKSRPVSPPTPGTPALRTSHRRSASTQSNLYSAGLGATGKRRDISNTSLPPDPKDWTSDMSSDEAASYPPIPKLAPPPRSGRAAYRAQTSPARTVPTGKRADKFGSTPLARACERGNLKAVKTAYSEVPGEIDQPDNGGFTPLQKAALEGYAEIVQFLLEKGCRKDCSSKDEQDTPLIDAVENGHIEVVKLLLDHGVNPHHQNKSGKRAIDALDQDEEYASDIKELLQKAMNDYIGSDSDDDDDQGLPDIRDEARNRTDLLYLEPNRQNLLDYSRRGDVVAVDHFLSSVDPDNACAVVAARGGHHLVLNLLLASAKQQLEKDPDPLRYDETPLLAAIGRGHLKIIRLLLQQDNFNPTRKTKDGKAYWELAEARRGPRWQAEKQVLKEYYDAYLAKRKVQKKKKIHSISKMEKSRKETMKEVLKDVMDEPSSSPQAVKDKKMARKAILPSSDSREGKRKYRPVLESSDSEHGEEAARISKKSMRKRQGSTISKESRDDASSPNARRHSSGTRLKREDSKAAREIGKNHTRTLSSEKRHSSDAEIENSVKVSTPDAIRDLRKAEEETQAARAAEAERARREAERLQHEAEEAAAQEAARREEERLRKEKEEQERKEREERERKHLEEEQKRKDLEERERRVASLPLALRVAVQKRALRPLHFRPATKEHPEELGISMQFLPLQTTPLRNIDSACDDSVRDELWIMNFQVVGILGLPSELLMTEFPHWQRIPVTEHQRTLFLETYDFSKIAQEYRWPQAGETGYSSSSIAVDMRKTRMLFKQMDPLCWVRYTDFESAVKMEEYTHLQGLRMRTVNARIKEEPDSAVDVEFSFEDDEPAEIVSNASPTAFLDSRKEEEDGNRDTITGLATLRQEEQEVRTT